MAADTPKATFLIAAESAHVSSAQIHAGYPGNGSAELGGEARFAQCRDGPSRVVDDREQEE
jgi:hypothetical protein